MDSRGRNGSFIYFLLQLGEVLFHDFRHQIEKLDVVEKMSEKKTNISVSAEVLQSIAKSARDKAREEYKKVR